jgi:hypothetical protein
MVSQVGIKVLKAASMQMPVFWVAEPCSLVMFTDVSELIIASIIRATHRYNPEGIHH